MPVDSLFTSIGFVGMSLKIFDQFFQKRLFFNLTKRTAAELFCPGICAMVKLNGNTEWQAFHKGRVLFLFGKIR